MADINGLVDQLSALTVLEAADLAKALEEKWGVSAAAAVAAAPAAAGSRSSRNRSRGRNAPLLFERLGEIRGLEDGQFGKLVDQLGNVSHFKLLVRG